MTKEIPIFVRQAAKELIDMYGENIEYLGEVDSLEYYVYCFPENAITGFPFVFFYNPKSNEVKTETGNEALDIICFFK